MLNIYNLHAIEQGEGAPVVLLHGMAGSVRSWTEVMDELSDQKSVAVDLLGFGHSPKPRSGEYSYEQHIKSILKTLKERGIKCPFTLVGFSMGALIAIRLAKDYPKLVKKLVLISPPIFKDYPEAKRYVATATGWPRWLLFGPLAHLTCKLWCRQRYYSKYLTPYIFRRLPKAVAQDAVYHTWRSYKRSLDNIMLNQSATQDLHSIKIPVNIIYGADDGIIVGENISKLRTKTARPTIHKLKASHKILFESPKKLAQFIKS